MTRMWIFKWISAVTVNRSLPVSQLVEFMTAGAVLLVTVIQLIFFDVCDQGVGEGNKNTWSGILPPRESGRVRGQTWEAPSTSGGSLWFRDERRHEIPPMGSLAQANEHDRVR